MISEADAVELDFINEFRMFVWMERRMLDEQFERQWEGFEVA